MPVTDDRKWIVDLHIAKTRLPRYLPVALSTSGVVHAVAVLAAGVLLNGALVNVFPPPTGRNSIQLAASPTAVSQPDPPAIIELETSVIVSANEQPLFAAAPPPVVEALAESEPLHVTMSPPPPIPRIDSPPEKSIPPDRRIPLSPTGELPPTVGETAPREMPRPAAPANLPRGPERLESARQPPPPSAPETTAMPRAKLPPPRVDHEARAVATATQVSLPSIDSQETRGAQTETPHQPIHSPEPEYPADALSKRQTGRVTLRVTVGTDGRVVAVSVLRTSGVPSLDQAALAAVRNWRFAPALRSGVAIETEIAVPIKFEIDD